MSTEIVYLSKHEMVVDKADYEDLLDKLKELKKIEKNLLTYKKLEDVAYKIATGNCTTKIMTKKQWEKCKTSNFMWEPFETLGEDFVNDHVSDIAHGIIREFKDIAAKEDK